MTRWAIVVDLNRCVGCQTCTSACKHANATAPNIQWRKVLDFQVGEFPDVSRAFLPVGCMHCDEPPCMDVCPTTATGKRDDGIVTIDYDLCIGCAYCIVACPYQARSRVDKPAAAFGGKAMRHEALREDPARIGVAQKCTLCVDRIDTGLAQGLTPGVDEMATPACVSSCIAGALYFGDIEDEQSNVSMLLKENRHFRMHEELGTGPQIHYLYDGEINDGVAVEPAPLVAEPVGLGAVSPVHQKSWDWRAAANFIFGGTGTGLLAATMLAGLFTPTLWLAVFLALALVGSGLFCVWLEIGRPWRFLNVYRNAKTSWMTREAFAALPVFAFGGLALLLVLLLPGSLSAATVLGILAALSGLVFLYCQGQILRASKGIPAWRQSGIAPLIFSTGLVEGTGLYSVFAYFSGYGTGLLAYIGTALLVLVVARYVLWRNYRAALGKSGGPTGVFQTLDDGLINLSLPPQALVLALLVAGFYLPVLVAVAGLLALATGWGFKFALVTRAAFNQGFAMNRMPARGAGKSAPGIKPGWTMS